MTSLRLAICVSLCMCCYGQQASVEQILQQLNQLQRENQKLNQELDNLRKQVLELQAAKPAAQADEKLAVVQQRVEDLDSSKVEAAQKFPLKLSGLVLMNSYLYAGRTGGVELPMVSVPGASRRAGGGTLRNTQIA